MEDFLILAAFILSAGACIGSFLNVVALRALTNESIVFPSSKCPKCNTPIKWYDNIPVLSYLFTFKGKCRSCGEKVSIQYPIVEAITSILFLAVFIGFGITLQTLFLLIILCISIVISITDLKEKSVFTRHLWYLIILSFLYAYFIRHDILSALIGAVVAVVLMEVVSRGAFFLLGNKTTEEEGVEEQQEEFQEPKTVLKNVHLVLAMLMAFYLFLSFGVGYALAISILLGAVLIFINYFSVLFFAKVGEKYPVKIEKSEDIPEKEEIIEYIKENKRLFGEGDTYIAAAAGAALGWKAFIAVFVLAVLLQVICIIPQFLKGLYAFKQYRRLACILIVLVSVLITFLAKTMIVVQYVICPILLYFGIDYVIRDRLSMRISTSNFIPFAPPLLWATFIMFFFGDYILKVIKGLFV